MTINSNFYYWGPLLMRSSVMEEEMKIVDSIYERSLSNKIYHSHGLQSQFENEFLVDEVDKKLLSNIISPNITNYLKFFNNSFTNFKPVVENPTMEVSWINYQQAFEFRPPHKHNMDLVYVLYVDIPEEIIKESELNNKEKIGAVFFDYGYDLTSNNFALPPNCQFSFLPKRGDIFIFPNYLVHYSMPFRSQVVRKSISGNYKLT